MTAPDAEALRMALLASPALFPLELNGAADAVCFASLSEQDYREASFLDRRIVGPATRTGLVPRSLMRPWLEPMARGCDFIFHVSHAGSTLLSRLLGCHPAVWSLREPAILRQVAAGDAAEQVTLLDEVIPLLARTFHAGQRALIKATSIVNRIACPLMEQATDGRALLMTVPAETFVAAVLDGSPGDITAHAAERLARLQALGVGAGLAIERLTVGEAAAMSWLCENLALAEVARRYPGRSAWLDFDRFLEAPAEQLARAFAAFGLEGDVVGILAGDHMRRYAKRTDVAYDAEFRRRLLADARGRLGGDIEAGLAWLDSIDARRWLAGAPVRLVDRDGH